MFTQLLFREGALDLQKENQSNKYLSPYSLDTRT